jgi:hypothetical protein
MAEQMPHEGHDKHMCYLVEKGILKNDLDEYKSLVKKSKYYCSGCGRTAKDPKNLCAPVRI